MPNTTTQDQMQRSLAAALVANGMGWSDANEAVDLATHATDVAVRAMLEVTTRASRPAVNIQANYLAAQLLSERLEIARKAIHDSIVSRGLGQALVVEVG